MKTLKYSFALVLILFAGMALATPNPMVMLKSTTHQLLASLKQNRASLKNNPTYVNKIVSRILLPKVDVRVMSMSVLGRNAWRQATPAQRQEFTKLFTVTVVKTYSSALNAFTDEQVVFFPIRGGYQGRKILTINSQITRPDGPAVPINYSVILSGNQWKVYDLSVEGISLLQSFRSQFASQLSQGKTVADIIATLKAHNEKMKS